MFRSATLKLTLYYLALVMVISFGFSLILYHDASNELTRQLRQQYQRWNFAIRYFDYDPDTPAPAPPDPLAEIRSGQHHLVLELLYFNLLVLIAAGGTSYMLARKTLQPIEIAHEQQKRFTADVSHELRTPLTALKMESEVALLDPKATAKQLRGTLASNLEEAEKLETLINNILKLSRLENTLVADNFTSVTIDEALQRAIDQLRIVAQKRQIDITEAITAEAKTITVNGDPTMLTQLATIILDNAVKYSPNKSTVHVKLYQAHNNAVIEVIDQGIGIESTALPHVFDRFYRADKARSKSDSQGYGLGLSLAKMIAELHGGSVTIQSAPQQGTTVLISLPVRSNKQ